MSSDENEGSRSAGLVAVAVGKDFVKAAGLDMDVTVGFVTATASDRGAVACVAGFVAGAATASSGAAGTVNSVWHLGHFTLVPALRAAMASACRQLVQAKRMDMAEGGCGENSIEAKELPECACKCRHTSHCN